MSTIVDIAPKVRALDAARAATEDKPRVRKSRKDGLWIAELPVLAGGVLVGWYSERFDRQEFALSFASRGPIRRDPESAVTGREED